MWSAVKKVGSFFGLVSEEPEYDINEIMQTLTYGPPGRDSDGGEENGLNCQDLQDEMSDLCQNRSGIVTCLTDDFCVVDGQYQVDLKICLKEREVIRVGSRITYIAYRHNKMDEWQIRKVMFVENESWLDDDSTEKTAETEPTAAPVVNKVLDVMDKSIIGRVIERNGREVTIEPDMITFSLDNVEAGFIPIPGDWVELDTLVQTDLAALEIVDTNIILKVMKVRPLRTRVYLGRVTYWDPKTLSGTIRTEIFFNKDALDFGYTPTVGDLVVVDSIESNQHGFLWRALTVVLYRQTLQSEENQAADDKLNVLLADKEDVVISRDCSFGVMDVGREKSISVEVTNNGCKDYWITEAEFVSPSQINLMCPTLRHGPLSLPSGKTLTFKFKASPRFIGKSSELFVWTFEDFKIGRNLEVDVRSDMVNNCMKEDKELSNNYRWKKYTKPNNDMFNLQSVYGTPREIVVPGERPVKNPSFIPVRLGSFIMPRKLVRVFESASDTTFGHGEKLSTLQLKEAFPCLNEAPNPASYSERLHTLLFLEEIENIYRLSQFNIEGGCFRHYGKYLTLNIEGLSEKRPSLIVGDKVIVSRKDDDGRLLYEGYIHKILTNEILIQFNEGFHNMCDGEHRIKFEMSRGNFVKCHQAVKLVDKHLKADWLFPTCVKYRPAQIIITGETNYIGSTENSFINEKGSDRKNIDDEMKSTVVPIKNGESNGVIISCVGKIKELCIDSPQDTVNSNINPHVNNFEKAENIINDLNKNCEKENLSVSVPQFNQVIGNKCNGEKMKKTLEDQSPDSNKDDVSIVAEEGEEIKKVSKSLYSCVVTGNTVQTRSVESDTVNRKVHLVFEHLKNAESENNLNEKSIKGNNEASDKIWTVQEIERFSCLESDAIRKPPADKMSTSSSPDNTVSQNNTAHRRGKMSQETKHNKRRSVQEMEIISYEENKCRIPSNGKMSTTNSSSNMSRKNMGARRGQTHANSKSKDSRRKLRFWFEESETDEADSIVKEIKKREIQWFNPRLNHYQKEAVRNILRGEARPLPYVIFGPPGTGKTITLVETILQIYHLVPDCRLLVGTPSNSSADLISQRLLESGVIYPGNLTRLVGYNYMQEGRLPVNLLPYTAVASMSEVKNNNAMNMTMGRTKITVGTCNTLGILYNAGFQRGHFSHVIIDEAGQGTEPELLIPLAFLSAKYGQSVLAGDPNQLGPVILSRYAKEFGLGESFLVRLLHTAPYQKDNEGFCDTHGYNPHLVTLLVENYRSLPDILTLPSNLFYNGLLVPKVNEKDSEEFSALMKIYTALDLPLTRHDGRPPSAILFHGVRGEDHQSEDSPSWFNPHEIMECMVYLRRLYDSGLAPQDCGILTPYNKQAAKIRRMIERLHMDPPKVGSVEEFQGQERMAIIMSSVRTSGKLLAHDIKHNMGFIACPRRLNVALTRARAMLIIIGDPHLLAMDVYWKNVLKYCVKNNAYIGCDLPYILCNKE